MTTTINASTSSGIVATADGSGILKVQSNGKTTNALAWAYFNGSTAAINASYNVSSITRNSTGDYTLTFSTTMSDANYVLTGTAGTGNTANAAVCSNYNVATPTTSAVRFQVTNSANVYDATYVNVAIFGN